MKSSNESHGHDNLSTRPAGGVPGNRRLRVLYFIVAYPTFSETYMHEEIRSLKDECEIKIITYRDSPHPRLKPFPYELIEYQDPCLVHGPHEQVDSTFSSPTQREFVEKVETVIRDFKPDVLHCHYFGLGLLLGHLAEKYQIPFTIRTHSMDVLSEPLKKLQVRSEAANSPLCSGVFVFAAFRERLIASGLAPEKLIDCTPTINFARFYKPERRPQTRRVLCTGPATRKKAHSDFIDLAASMRGTGFTFDLYAKGIYLKATAEYNDQAGHAVNIKYTDPDDMPEIYPQYDWLVYPGSKQINKVGFPISIPEAQASGLGVCWQELPGRREEQLEFLGGAGFLFRSISEVPAILAKPYPEEMRVRGFEVARRCDADAQKTLFTAAWLKHQRAFASM